MTMNYDICLQKLLQFQNLRQDYSMQRPRHIWKAASSVFEHQYTVRIHRIVELRKKMPGQSFFLVTRDMNERVFAARRQIRRR